MTRFAALAAFLFVPSLWAVDADPAKLRPTEADLARAEALVKLLGSDVFRERDQASRELAEMGRAALIVVERTLAETDSAEVRARCEALRPEMRRADLRARLDVFMADTDGKYDHKLPAWDKFQKMVGNSETTRKLFTEMFENAGTAKLLAASEGPREDFAKLVADRRVEIYNRMYGRARFVAANGVIMNTDRQMPTIPETAGLLFSEAILGSTADRRYSYAVTNMIQQSPAKDLLNDAEKGVTFRKLLVAWCDSRVEGVEQYQAMNLVANLNIKDISPAKYALKVLEGKGTTPFYRAYALTTLARTGGKDQLPNLIKYFDDKTVFSTAAVNNNGVVERTEIQIRDIALAMAVIVSGEQVEDYGLVRRNTNDTSKFTYSTYRMPNDEARTKAFAKWDEAQKKPKK